MGNRGVPANGRRKIKRVRAKANGDFGVEVDQVDGQVVATFYAGNTVVSMEWRKTDALQVASMIERATFSGEDKEEVVRGSGLVMPTPDQIKGL